MSRKRKQNKSTKNASKKSSALESSISSGSVIKGIYTHKVKSLDGKKPDKRTCIYYDKTDIHLEDTFKVYFKSLNSNELDNILKYVNVEVMNYIIDDKKYYARNINELTKTFIKDKSIEEKIYYELNGIKIDGITITCEVNELMKLEKLTKVY